MLRAIEETNVKVCHLFALELQNLYDICSAFFSENIDECLSNPCQNDGTCNEGTNSYTCACVAGFSGDHCEGSYYPTGT